MIPYERQIGRQTCGAASLTMIYRSFGLDITQQTVLSETGMSRRSIRLATHARGLGFRAILVRLDEGGVGIRSIRKTYPDCGIVLNHRLVPGASYGHYSVVSDMTEDYFILHDPLFGPDRKWTPDTLEVLWGTGGGEITGKVAMLIRRHSEPGHRFHPCRFCHRINDLTGFAGVLNGYTSVFCAYCDRNIGE